MNTVIGIQARSGSTRLKQKSLQTIGDKAIIDHCVETCRLTRLPVYVLPPADDFDMVGHCYSHNYLCHITEANENDVLSRYVALQRATGADHVVRITGDCPFPLLPMISWAITMAQSEKADFVTNVQPPRTMPDGWDVEVLSPAALRVLNRCSTENDREHITPAFYREKTDDVFQYGLTFVCLNYPLNLSNIKMSVDTQEDLDRVRSMYVCQTH